MCDLVLEWYSHLIAERREDDHGLDRGERFLCGVCAAMIPWSLVACASNQESSVAKVATGGGGEQVKPLSSFLTSDQLV